MSSHLLDQTQPTPAQVMIAACDTFRSGAVEQLKTHCARLQVRPLRCAALCPAECSAPRCTANCVPQAFLCCAPLLLHGTLGVGGPGPALLHSALPRA